MKLSKVLDSLEGCVEEYSLLHNPDITGIKMDSRKVMPGDLFVAISGYQSDGHHYIKEAIEKGAAAILGERIGDISIPFVVVQDSRPALGKIASSYYGYPSKKRKVIGITGTNGKTTVSYIVKHILDTAGRSCSLFGTVNYVINNEVYEPVNTTPDSLLIQEMISKSNDEFVVLEVSSHALEQSRIEGLEIDYGLFTNLSHDHLDYHHSMDEYFTAKAKMYEYLKPGGKAVINIMNPWGAILSDRLKSTSTPVIELGEKGSGDLSIEDIKLNGETFFSLKHGQDVYGISFPYPGLHNVYNASLAFLTALDLGIRPEVIVNAMESFPGVPGRFEMMQHPSGATFIIDYAHTEDAIEYCLQAAKEHDANKIIHIYGFRGERDTTKRENMVMASAALSDSFYLTLDDLNGTSEEDMLSELQALNKKYGLGKGTVIADRTLAIQKAWETAEKGDWILITGKGPEEYKVNFELPVSSDKDALLYLQKTKDGEQVV
ncbi:UDP-N-acetylmuramoyl-L-alanyl-D-glutamate--2,6-diaminopimelate ligase [Mesobacillus harenae]|uniref:UDP-N-acetylmuramoyl-L-alanyl-D-glutamate--2, 6-diaminopimelate ligase n=1 Tax=Mesobacillus harenae TaxID=2213203 RepID=UPI00158071B7|nr:UDP-N-acetylmuramoyl-L-alanyl-D-glutamate--2,6-diaminopimelate ligase [Mesobacillus harenae]